GDAAELDDRLARRPVRGLGSVASLLGGGFHQLPFSLIRCPSDSSGVGLATTRVPGAGPSTSSKPCPNGGPSFTGAILRTPSVITNTTLLPFRSAMAVPGTTFFGFSLIASADTSCE